MENYIYSIFRFAFIPGTRFWNLVLAANIIDITPFSFVPTVFLLAWGILRYHLLGVLPMAPAMILQALRDGVIVIDNRKRILYLNNLAEQLLQTTAEAALGQPIESIRPACQEAFHRFLDKGEPFVEQEFELNDQNRFFDIRISDLSKVEQGIIHTDASHLITFRDIYQRKQVELSLKRREAIMGALNRYCANLCRETLVGASRT